MSQPTTKYADQTEVRAAQLMTPELANHYGTVHGGHVLRLVDNIAFVCAARYSGTVCVTAAVDRVDFYEPVHVGELVTFVARIAYVGKSSMEVDVEVLAEEIATGNVRKTNSCTFTMVSLVDGKPNAVPRLVCRSREDKAHYIQAKMRRDLSLRYRKERDSFLHQFDDMDDADLDALINQSTAGLPKT